MVRLRQAAGFSQQRLAAWLGITQSEISKIVLPGMEGLSFASVEDRVGYVLPMKTRRENDPKQAPPRVATFTDPHIDRCVRVSADQALLSEGSEARLGTARCLRMRRRQALAGASSGRAPLNWA